MDGEAARRILTGDKIKSQCLHTKSPKSSRRLIHRLCTGYPQPSELSTVCPQSYSQDIHNQSDLSTSYPQLIHRLFQACWTTFTSGPTPSPLFNISLPRLHLAGRCDTFYLTSLCMRFPHLPTFPVSGSKWCIRSYTESTVLGTVRISIYVHCGSTGATCE